MTLTRDRRIELLATAPLFAGVDEAGLARVAERAIEVEFPAGGVIARQGDVGTGFFLVASGSVRIVRDGETIATLGPGEFFGELSVPTACRGRPRSSPPSRRCASRSRRGTSRRSSRRIRRSHSGSCAAWPPGSGG
jgi:hypothetical protein